MNTVDVIGKLNLPKLAEVFARHNIEYIIIGGAAATLLGSPLITFDIDVCYRRDRENLVRLVPALQEFQPTLRGAPPGLPFVLDARSLELGSNFTFDTNIGPLDLLGWVEPFGTYEELLPRAESTSIGQHPVRIIGLDDLIAVKQHIRRPKDQAALFQLLAIKKIREESSPR